MKAAFLPSVGQVRYGKQIKSISANITNQLGLPLSERFQKMRKVTDKIEFKDNKHPFDMMKSYYKKRVKPAVKKLLAAANSPDGPDGNDINKNINKLNVEKYYKNMIEKFKNNNLLQSNFKK